MSSDTLKIGGDRPSVIPLSVVHRVRLLSWKACQRQDPGEMLMRAVSITYAFLLVACGAEDAVPGGLGERAEIVLSEEPIWSVGIQGTEPGGGSSAMMFERISGGERLEDGSVVVADEGAAEVRKFAADGAHLWTVGGRGEGPGDFEGLALLRNCSEGKITVYDRHLFRVTEFGQGGELLGTWAVPFEEAPPYSDQEVTCAPDGRIAYHTAGEFPSEPGMVRWQVQVRWTSGASESHVLREHVPGPEKILDGSSYWDRPWSKVLVLGATGEGVWMGTSDDHAMELIGWDGNVVRTLQWSGDDLVATQEDAVQFLEELTDGDDEAEKERFARESWPDYEEVLPARVPAYSRLIVSADGSLWVGSWNGVTWWPRLPRHPGRSWNIFDRSGTRTGQVTVPANMSVLDAGPDWVLVVVRDHLNVQSLAVYKLSLPIRAGA